MIRSPGSLKLERSPAPGGQPIFRTIDKPQFTARRLGSLAASIALNIGALTGLSVLGELQSARRASDRLTAALRKELGSYRIVMLEPGMALPPVPQPAAQPGPARSVDAVKPLDQPDPRYLQRLDPALLDFVKENPAIESIITRELVRDVDRKSLDLSKLLKHSALQVSFVVDEEGRTHRRRVTQSSTVPSLDHLALELVKLLEKYGLLASLKGLQAVTIRVAVDREIEVDIEGSLGKDAVAEEIRVRAQTILTLARFALAEDAAFLLQEVKIEANADRIRLSRVFPKEPLVAFLTEYFRKNRSAAQEAPPPAPPPP